MKAFLMICIVFIQISCNSNSKNEQTPEITKEIKPKVKALLIHMTHYDPSWCKDNRKETEAKFDLETALQLVEEMKGVGLNTLIVDIEDGVKYESHPELTRHYSVEMEELVTLVTACRENGIEFIPKLNFSKSGRNVHDKWLSPHWDLLNFIPLRNEYFKVAFEVMDELIEKCGPFKYFHIGMDEDHHRSLNQFVTDIIYLHDYLESKNIKTVVWNDGCYRNRNVIAEVHADKCMAAAPLLPNDIIHVFWDYDIAHKGLIKEIKDMGFDVWVAPGNNPENIKNWAEIMKTEGGSGFLLTNWTKCGVTNRDRLVKQVQEQGKLISQY